jgi:hypothetical protein
MSVQPGFARLGLQLETADRAHGKFLLTLFMFCSKSNFIK